MVKPKKNANGTTNHIKPRIPIIPPAQTLMYISSSQKTLFEITKPKTIKMNNNKMPIRLIHFFRFEILNSLYRLY